MAYVVGQRVECDGRFSRNGRPVDPETVFCTVETPSGDLLGYEYSVDVELVRVKAGHYRVLVDATESGDYQYRFSSQGDYVGADEDTFSVEASELP